MESQSVGGKYKKKKKMSYMQKMRKFGKSGRFGQGREVDKDTYDYFLRVMEANRNGFDDDEAKAAFVANVFCQTEGSETALCGNQVVFLLVLSQIKSVPKHSENLTAIKLVGVPGDRGSAALGQGRGEAEIYGGDGRRLEDRGDRRLRQSRHREAPLLGRIREGGIK